LYESTTEISSDDQNHSTTESLETPTEELLLTTESLETSTSLLEIISTTPGIETTNSYLDTVIDSTEVESSTPSGFHLTTKINQSEEKTTTPRQPFLVEDYVRQRPRKMKYTSDTEPELYWY